jgi:hypothetical protein
MRGYGQLMTLLYAQQMKGRKLTVGEALNILNDYKYHLGQYLNRKG